METDNLITTPDVDQEGQESRPHVDQQDLAQTAWDVRTVQVNVTAHVYDCGPYYFGVHHNPATMTDQHRDRHGTQSTVSGLSVRSLDDTGLHTDTEDMVLPNSGHQPPRLEFSGSVPSNQGGGQFVANTDKQQLIFDDDPELYEASGLPSSGAGYDLRGEPARGSFPTSQNHSNTNSISRGGPYHCHVVRLKGSKKARNQLIIVTFLSGLFLAAELTGGLLANSLALVTDATHMASDLSGFLVSLFAIWIATKPPTERMSLGFFRAEVIGALISVLIIWVTTAVLLYLAVKRFINQDFEINADDMLITAGLGVAFNIVMMVILNSGNCNVTSSFGHNHSHGGHEHSHGGNSHDEHGHSHDSEHHSHSINSDPHSNESSGEVAVCVDANGAPHRNSFRLTSNSVDGQQIPKPKGKKPEEEQNINVRAAFIHVIGDFIQSVGVLVAAFVIKYKPDYKLADPVCTFVFSFLVLCTTIAILRDALSVLMEGVPRTFKYKEAKHDLRAIPGVCAVHSLHVWALTIDKIALAVHIAVVPGTDRDQILRDATSMLRDRYKVHTSTIQVENFEEDLMQSCEQCTGPTSA